MLRQIEEKVKQYIHKNKLIQEGDTIVVGVSGGADSMMLLHFLNKYKDYYRIQLKVAHVHHGIRLEADEDQAYVEAMAKEWGIPCYIHHCDVKKIAKERKMSEEEVGREERYGFFISLTNQNGKIATAHNTNDQAETLIMRFLRGADIKGLGGILAKRDRIIRPILCLTRQEIECYCQANHIAFCTDHTNYETVYTRNKVRLECIPYIEKNINPNIHLTLFEHSQIYQEQEAFLEAYTQDVFNRMVKVTDEGVKIHIEDLQKEKVYIQKRILYKSLSTFIGHTKDIGLKHINQMIELLDMHNGKKICLPYNCVVYRDYEVLTICMEKKALFSNYEYTLHMGINNIEALNIQIDMSIVTRKTFEQSQQNMYTKYIDYDKIKNSLCLRTRRQEDYIVLKNGSKKLKKFYIDEKISQNKRDSWPILVDGQEVVWVLDSRLNINYFVTDQTENILEIKVIK